MKINLRILFQQDAIRPLLETGEFNEDELQNIVIDLDADSPRLAVFLEATKRCSGNWFNPLMIFSKKELDQAEYFQLDCRKTVGESPRDMEWNQRHVESLQRIRTVAGLDIYLPHRIAASKIKNIKSNMVAGVGQNLQEYIVPDNVGAAFAAAGLEGYSLLPFYDSRTEEAHVDVRQLYSNSIMPAAVLDRSTPPADRGLRQLGCLVYEDLDSHAVTDFNRTAEDWAAGNMPLWVVSVRVREVFQRNKFRGWAFRPVLEKGSEMHAEYLRLWDDLFARVAVNPQNFF